MAQLIAEPIRLDSIPSAIICEALHRAINDVQYAAQVADEKKTLSPQLGEESVDGLLGSVRSGNKGRAIFF